MRKSEKASPQRRAAAVEKLGPLETAEDFVRWFDDEEFGGSLRNVTRHVERSYPYVRRRYVWAVRDNLMPPLRVGAKPTRDIRDPRERERRIRKDAQPRAHDGEAVVDEPVLEGRTDVRRALKMPLPAEGKVRRYILTAAQNNTKVHSSFDSLEALARHYDAEIHVARFTYVKSGLGASGDKAKVLSKQEHYGGTELWYDRRLERYFSDERVELAPGLVWCGEMNILPTAANPLSGLEVYTGRASAVIPHPKIALQSVSSNKHEPTKFNYTTGCATLRNYIQRKAGLKAEFHHCYGGLLVEVDSNGDWWCRQLNADNDGVIYDLDVRADGDEVTTGHRVDHVYWGDPHVEEMDPMAFDLAFGEGGMKDALRPHADFYGDVISFKGRGHHEIDDPHMMYRRHIQGLDRVTACIEMAGRFLRQTKRPWCQTYAVNGNHERHLGRWLKERDGRKDPINAEFWIAMQGRVYDHIRAGGVEPNYLELALDLVDPEAKEGVIFLAEDESVVRLGIELGAHGDRGARGAKGTPRGFARMGRKQTIGDKHGCSIVDGVYVAGTFSLLDTDWTRGPSDWSHSHVIGYPNGKRAVVTCWNGKWRA